MARKGTKRVKNESSADERESDGEHEDKVRVVAGRSRAL